MHESIPNFLNELRTAHQVSAHTVRAYAADLADYAGFLQRFGVVSIGMVTSDLARRFLDTLEAMGRRASTRRRRLTAVRSLHRFAFEHGLAPEDPTIGLRAPRTGTRLPGVLTEQQIERLILAADQATALGSRDRAMVELAYSAGLRVSELTALSLGDLDLTARTILITGKGNRQAIGAVGDAAAVALGAYLQRRDELAPASDALFIARGGSRISPRTFRLTLRVLARKAGIAGRVHPHMLRHSCATHMHERGADILVIKEVLRHRQVSTTLVYTHFDRTRIREAQKKFHPRG